MGYGRFIRLCLAIGAAGLLIGVAITAIGGSSATGPVGGTRVTAPQPPPAPTPAPSVAPAVLLPVNLPTPPPTPSSPPDHPAAKDGGDSD